MTRKKKNTEQRYLIAALWQMRTCWRCECRCCCSQQCDRESRYWRRPSPRCRRSSSPPGDTSFSGSSSNGNLYSKDVDRRADCRKAQGKELAIKDDLRCKNVPKAYIRRVSTLSICHLSLIAIVLLLLWRCGARSLLLLSVLIWLWRCGWTSSGDGRGTLACYLTWSGTQVRDVMRRSVPMITGASSSNLRAAAG